MKEDITVDQYYEMIPNGRTMSKSDYKDLMNRAKAHLSFSTNAHKMSVTFDTGHQVCRKINASFAEKYLTAHQNIEIQST